VNSVTRLVLAVVLLTAIAAAAGGWAGIRYAVSEDQSRTGLDGVVHRELNLAPEQNRRIEALEAQFAARRSELEQDMRAANRDLAAAIAAEHVFGPLAQSAIERFHKAESALEEETVKHVLAMRTVLTREQTRQFDEAISKSLTSD
jgi:nickel and cobalt resistance protein CnrR